MKMKCLAKIVAYCEGWFNVVGARLVACSPTTAIPTAGFARLLNNLIVVN